MRTHKYIKEIKERYDYDLSLISQKEVEEIVMGLYQSLNIKGVCPPIIDIVNRLGFSVYAFPFKKEHMDAEKIKGFLGVGIQFNINENDNFFLIEKDDEICNKRMATAYLLAYYMINIDDRGTDYYHYLFHVKDFKNDVISRLALTLLMPENVFLAELELIALLDEIQNRKSSKEEQIQHLANVFRVSKKMVESRLILLKIYD